MITASRPTDSDVVAALREAGLRVRPRRLVDAVDEIMVERPDVIVLDIPEDRRVRPLVEAVAAAPDTDGVPLVVIVGPLGLTEASGVSRVTDMVLRPLRPAEVVARVRRPLAVRSQRSGDRILVGGLVIDLKGYEATIDGQPIDLTYQEFELMKFLAAHPGQAFTRDQLLSRVWGYDYYGGSRTVDIHVRRIRAKLGHPYAGCVQTVRHVGYKWGQPDDGG